MEPLRNGPALVGRDREQRQLRDWLASTREGNGGLVLVGGEAGIGKTALVRDVTNHARSQGTLVLTGACYDLTMTPPYGPWIEIIRSYTPGGVAPPVPAWFSDPDELSKIGGQPALFEEVRSFFSAIAEQRPLLLVLEDLHWSDPVSPDLLRYLARNLTGTQILLIATYRHDHTGTDHPFIEAMPALVREANAERIDLRRWQVSKTRDLIERLYTLQAADARRLTTYVHTLADGNPFYTLELLRTLEGDRTLAAGDDGWHLADLTGPQVPALVRQVIERRLTQLPEKARELLEIAAIIGYTVDFDLWQAVCNADNGQLASAIDAARHSQLIEEIAGRTGFQFRHALVRETLYAAVNPLLLRDLHQQVAERLIDRSSPDPDAVAYHLGRAGDSRQFQWLISAGERAQHRFAWHSAVERFESAQQLLAGAGDREEDRGWLLLRIGLLLRFSNQRASLDYLEHAMSVARSTGDRPLAAFTRFYRGLVRHYIDLSGVPDLEESVAAIDDLQESEMADVSRRIERGGAGYLAGVVGIGDQRGTLASALFQIGRLEDAIASGEAFIDTVYARENDATRTAIFCRDAHGGLAVAYALIGQPRLARQMFTLAEQGYRSIGNTWVLKLKVQENLNLFMLPYYTDNIDDRNRAEALVLDAWHQVTRVVQDYEEAVLRADYGLGFIDGRWRDAMEAAMICSDPRWDAITRLMAARAVTELHFHLGNVDRFRECVATTLPQGPRTEPGTTFISTALRVQQLAAEQSLISGDLKAARDWLEANDRWFAWSKALLLRAEGQIAWSHFALRAGDPAAARAHAERARSLASDPRQPLALITARRTLGELDTLEQSFENAGTHLAAALSLAERCQAPYEIALVQLAQADLAHATGDTIRATGLLQNARATFQELNALPALNRAGTLAEQLTGQRHYPDGLSPREVEVLCLIADGLSNRDIATHLYLSVRTVERHISNIYQKIDVHNRVEATAFTNRHHLSFPADR